jgi:hypothetical protein
MKKAMLFNWLVLLAYTVRPQLTIQPGATVHVTGDAQVSVQNMNLINNGSIVPAVTSRFIFTGNTDNLIDGLSPSAFGELEMGKTGGSRLFLKSDITISGKIEFKSGLFELNGYSIDLDAGAFLENEREASRITGIYGGQVRITVILNAPIAVNPGNLGAVITAAGNLGKTTVIRGHASQANASGAGNSIYRYYDISPDNNTALNAILRFQYFDAELNGLGANTLLLYKSSDHLHWTVQGFDTRDVTLKYVTQKNITDFSRWTLSSPNNPLPLQWGLVKSQCINGSIDIQWQTLQEHNTQYFFVQRSFDGLQWAAIGRVAAAGNSNTTLNYHYTDPSPVSYYRIVQTDIDGRFSYSMVLRNTCSVSAPVQLFPNPARSNITLQLFASGQQRVLLQIIDVKGALVQWQTAELTAGRNQLNMQVSQLPAGAYQLLIHRAGATQQIISFEKY